MNTGAIQFTQYLLPRGQKRQTTIVRPVPVAEQAERLAAAGCRFEIELLTTGQVSMTIERDDDEGETEVLGMEIVSNGPDVPPAVDKMVGDAFSAVFSASTEPVR